jgi:hypothetical protein
MKGDINMKKYSFEKIKEEIINILENNYLSTLGNKKNFLIDDDGEEIDFQNEKYYVLCDKGFKLTLIEGDIILGVSNNENVTDKWISQLYLAKKAQEKIQRLIDMQCIYDSLSK